jgi:hypothetical protein
MILSIKQMEELKEVLPYIMKYWEENKEKTFDCTITIIPKEEINIEDFIKKIK